MIAFYEGISSFSRAIRINNFLKYNGSPITHVSWIDDRDGRVFEAWRSGVVSNKTLKESHTPGTKIHVCQVIGETDQIRNRVRLFMEEQVGAKYDWGGIFGFVSRTDLLENQDRWFCSEIVTEALRLAGHPLLKRIDSSRVYPATLATSPLIVWPGEAAPARIHLTIPEVTYACKPEVLYA